ncbi:DNA-binding response regulator, OmpR family, contains REC and winged-helix (wHTH) domain [Arthrobacter cupressi]|uniref:DNA-binding response regulator, OmpR family, contains REC and winged-helix (WHTH) domain n=1 Tax=Arthrobacter cupressi TaxID=1045773 RepID=A0A1G8RY29_9MICC|nr:DNA-binding response regulator, OmpR family, contains REC and winged-helix (wHTH) domain [Arthrobacter cupressi]
MPGSYGIPTDRSPGARNGYARGAQIYAGRVNKAFPRGTSEPGTAEPGNRRVLVVEDEATLAGVVRDYLVQAGFQVRIAGDGFSALDLAAAWQPDLVLLDRMLPGLDGVEVCRRLRRAMSVPVIMVTALGTEDDRILGLETGADDYVTKPFSPRELVLRVKSVLRRSIKEFSPEPPVETAGFVLDPGARTVLRHGEPLALTLREFDLLAFLLRRPKQVFSREELIKAVWGWDFGDLSTVTVHVRRLREKIEDDPTAPRLLKTVWGVGYRFDPPDSAGEPDAADQGDTEPEASRGER